MYSIYFFLLWP